MWREAVWNDWTNLNGVSEVRDGEICILYFYKYNCKYFNINDLINTLIMLSHKITSIISHQLSYSTFHKTSSTILNFYMKYFLVCKLQFRLHL